MRIRVYTRIRATTFEFVAAPSTEEDIGVLSYSFHHNNSPAYEYTRTNVCTGRSAERYRFNLALPFASPTATLFFSFTLRLSPYYSLHPSSARVSLSLSSLLLALLSTCSQTEPLPLLHLWPFELNLLTVALFLMAHFLPRNCYLNSFRGLLPLVSPCSITFTRVCDAFIPFRVVK